MPDQSTTVAELRDMIRRFVAERKWEEFHAPKNLSMALAIEAAELMEHFQWIGVELSRDLKHDAEKRAAIGEELADVICYALALANELELDVSETMQAKMRKNEAKYPAGEYQGKYGAEDDGRR